MTPSPTRGVMVSVTEGEHGTVIVGIRISREDLEELIASWGRAVLISPAPEKSALDLPETP